MNRPLTPATDSPAVVSTTVVVIPEPERQGGSAVFDPAVLSEFGLAGRERLPFLGRDGMVGAVEPVVGAGDRSRSP